MAKTKQTAKKWLDKIHTAEKLREKWYEHFNIATCYNYYQGDNKPEGQDDSEWSNVNFFYGILQSELPGLYSYDPYFYVSLKKSYNPTPEMIAQMTTIATVRQSMLNYLKGELDMKTTARLAIQDAYFQYGVVKVGYTANMVENPEAGKEMTDEETGNFLLDENRQPILEPELLPMDERYTITRVHPDDIIIDCNAGPLESSISFIAQRLKMSVEEVRENKKFSAKARKSITPSEVSLESIKESDERKKGLLLESENEDKPDTCVLYEVWDLKKKKFCVVGLNCEEYLVKPQELPAGIEDHPYSFLRWNLLDNKWLPMPPTSQWIDLQEDYLDIKSKMKTHRKRFNRKYCIQQSAFQDISKAVSDLQYGEDGTVLVSNAQQNPIFPIHDAPLDQQLYMDLNNIKSEFALIAAGTNQMGSGSGIDSATEASIIAKRTAVKESDKAGLVADFIKTIGRKLDQLIKANITEDIAIKVVGIEGEFWQYVKTDDYQDIAGEFDYSVDIGSMLPDVPELQRSQFLALLQLLAQAPQFMLSPALMNKLAAMYSITDKVLIQELQKLGMMMMQQQMAGMAGPGNMATPPGGLPGSPGSASQGMAMGMDNVSDGVGDVSTLRGGEQGV